MNFVSAVSNINGTTVATVLTKNYDKTGALTQTTNATYKCTGGAFTFDLSSLSSQSPNIKFSDSNISYPAGMKVGDHLPDVDIKMEVSKPGQPSGEMTVNNTNMQVIGNETITTPADTWKCLKITYQTKVDMPGVNVPPSTVTQWFVPRVGIVQYQTFTMTVKITAIH